MRAAYNFYSFDLTSGAEGTTWKVHNLPLSRRMLYSGLALSERLDVRLECVPFVRRVVTRVPLQSRKQPT